VRTTYAIIVLAVSWIFTSHDALAQSRYSCTVSGRTYQSTQPCPNNFGNYSPTSTQPRSERQMPEIGHAPAHLTFLSPRCASLNDAIRTAPARGLKYDAIGQMQREYREQCAENESEAKVLMQQDIKFKKEKLVEAKKAESMNKERSLIQQQECGESKRFLYGKRSRTDLTDGEKADLRRFEENYLSRCG
jgi:hypothetical protein